MRRMIGEQRAASDMEVEVEEIWRWSWMGYGGNNGGNYGKEAPVEGSGVGGAGNIGWEKVQGWEEGGRCKFGRK